MMKKILIGVALVACSTGAWAVNKCQMPDGKFVFQDAPCAGKGEKLEVKPASGKSTAAAPSSGASAPPSEADRLNASVAASQKERQKLELERRGLPSARNAVFGHRDECTRVQQALEAEKDKWRQNLWGKTNSAQMASEQAAAAARCDTKDRDLVNTHNLRLKECQDLGGCTGSRPL